MRLPVIKKYAIIEVEKIVDKIIEEWYEVKICYNAYHKFSNDKRRGLIVNKLIEELFDLLQVLTTMSYACLIKLDEVTVLDLSDTILYHYLLNKIDAIDEIELNLSNIKEIINSSYDITYNLLRVICYKNGVCVNEARRIHLNKLKSRGCVFND